jgi:hypothetical protein
MMEPRFVPTVAETTSPTLGGGADRSLCAPRWAEGVCTELAGPAEMRWRGYAWQSLSHPVSVVASIAVVSGAAAFALWMLPVALVASAVFAGAAPRCRFVRRHLTNIRQRRRCELILRERDRLVAAMSEEHARELRVLEQMAERIRDESGRLNCYPETWLDVDGLLAIYVTQAVDLCERQRRSEHCSRSDIETEIEELQAALAEDSAGHLASEVHWRIDIAERRLQTWEVNQRRLRAAEHQLAAIGSLVRLVYERSIARLDSRDVVNDIAAFVSELEAGEGAASELADLSEPAWGSRDPRQFRWVAGGR